MATARPKKRKFVTRTLITALFMLAAVVLLYRGALWYYPADGYAQQIDDACERFGVPQAVIYAVMKAESNFDADAQSEKHAVGLMQLMPDTFLWVGDMRGGIYQPDDITDSTCNIDAGVWFLSYLYAEYDNWETAYAAYNAGQGRVNKWLADREVSYDGVTLKHIPYQETKNYVNRVTRARKTYEWLYDMK